MSEVRRPETVVYCGVSLDGFIARADGAIDWLEIETSEADGDMGWSGFLASVDHIVMGRATFEQFVGFGVWPYESLRITVLSSTRATVPMEMREKAECSALAPTELLAKLAADGHKRVYIDGGKTVQSFMREDLIDELVVTTLPVLIGDGISLFGPIPADMAWQHVSTEAFVSGFVRSTWRRLRP